jgi:hypothetical protein
LNLPKSGNQRIVWDSLAELFRDEGSLDETVARLPERKPSKVPCLLLEEAIQKVQLRLPVEHKRQRERAIEAVKGLINRRLLGFDSGYIWPMTS